MTLGWAIDHLIWHKIRPYLKGRYAGIVYSMLTSNTPVIINYRSPELTGKEMLKIASWFPKEIRVEFQEVTYQGEQSQVYGRGDIGPCMNEYFERIGDWMRKDANHPDNQK